MESRIPYGEFAELVRYASMAPSGHNSQPWRFVAAGDTVSILPDFDRALAAVDGSNRELYISLGCAAENLCIAASHFGYRACVTNRDRHIAIRLEKSGPVAENPLFSLLERRQTNRSVYLGRKISEADQARLRTIPAFPGIRFTFAEIGTPVADMLTRCIVDGNSFQMRDRAFKRELVSWMRFNERQVERTLDGLTYRAMGFPSLPAFVSKPVVGLFLKPGLQNRSDLRKIGSSSHLVLITAERDTPQAWVDLGRGLERFLLEATGLGIASAYMNQPCEVGMLAEKMRRELPIDGWFPAVIVRLGYAGTMPYSPRREVRSVIG